MILKRMKRRYDRDMLYQSVERLRDRVPGIVFSADVMAGFPTESEDHFMETLNAINDLDITFPHVFPYSEREGTPAARIPKQLPKTVRIERAARLRAAGAEVSSRVMRRFSGQAARVLIESLNRDSGTCFGRTDNYLPVRVEGEGLEAGKFVQVDLHSVQDDCLMGTARVK